VTTETRTAQPGQLGVVIRYLGQSAILVRDPAPDMSTHFVLENQTRSLIIVTQMSCCVRVFSGSPDVVKTELASIQGAPRTSSSSTSQQFFDSKHTNSGDGFLTTHRTMCGGFSSRRGAGRFLYPDGPAMWKSLSGSGLDLDADGLKLSLCLRVEHFKLTARF